MGTKFAKPSKFLILILAAVMLGSLFSGCAKKEPSPADTIEALENALNKLDLEAFLGCLDSTWAQRIRPILALTVGENGISVEQTFLIVSTVLPFLPALSKGAIESTDLPKVKLTVEQITQEEEDAVVTLSGRLTLADYSKSFSATLRMRLENDVWVISGIQ